MSNVILKLNAGCFSSAVPRYDGCRRNVLRVKSARLNRIQPPAVRDALNFSSRLHSERTSASTAELFGQHPHVSVFKARNLTGVRATRWIGLSNVRVRDKDMGHNLTRYVAERSFDSARVVDRVSHDYPFTTVSQRFSALLSYLSGLHQRIKPSQLSRSVSIASCNFSGGQSRALKKP